jgi:hypothetical protein
MRKHVSSTSSELCLTATPPSCACSPSSHPPFIFKPRWTGLTLLRSGVQVISAGRTSPFSFAHPRHTHVYTPRIEIAHGAPGPTSTDLLHRELLDELLDLPRYRDILPELRPEPVRREMCTMWHKLDRMCSTCPNFISCILNRPPQHGRTLPLDLLN